MQTISMFEIAYPTFKIDKPVRLIELFAGVGSQAMALRNLGADFEHYKVVEYEKYAVASYNAIHDTDFKTTDITEIKGKDLEITEIDKYTYIMTYSFPCQDLSVAGNMKGMSRGSGTRSGLLWEVERLLNETEHLPQVLLMENVPQVISNANIKEFHEWQRFLEEKGYSNYADTLNAKEYGVAQNRNRTFMVSILGEYNYTFPKPIPLTKTMKDYLETEVDEKYYIKNDKANELIQQLVDKGQLENDITCVDGSINEPKSKEVMNCITARYDCGISNQRSIGGMVVEERADEGLRTFKDNVCGTIRTIDSGGDKRVVEVNQIANIMPTKNRDNPNQGRVFDKGGLCPSITCMEGGNLQPMIVASSTNKIIVEGNYMDSNHDASRVVNINGIAPAVKENHGTVTGILEPTVKIKQATQEGYIECKLGGVADLSYPTSKTRRGRVQDNGDTSPTITATETGIHKIESLYRIRKLTPLECWRLMGFTDEDYYKAEKVNSNSQLYKQAGNSIVVDVLEGIFKQML